MCMEDIRIGRKTLANEIIYTSPITTFQQILGPDENRIAITFCLPDTGVAYLITSDPTAAGVRGIQLNAGMPYITLTLETFGDLVRKPWYAKCNVAVITSTFTVSLAEQ